MVEIYDPVKDIKEHIKWVKQICEHCRIVDELDKRVYEKKNTKQYYSR